AAESSIMGDDQLFTPRRSQRSRISGVPIAVNEALVAPQEVRGMLRAPVRLVHEGDVRSIGGDGTPQAPLADAARVLAVLDSQRRVVEEDVRRAENATLDLPGDRSQHRDPEREPLAERRCRQLHSVALEDLRLPVNG